MTEAAGAPYVARRDADEERRQFGLLGALLGAASLVMASTTCVTAAIPEIGRELSATQTEIQWIADAYPVVLAALLLPAGALLDRYGRRRGLVAGLRSSRTTQRRTPASPACWPESARTPHWPSRPPRSTSSSTPTQSWSAHRPSPSEQCSTCSMPRPAGPVAGCSAMGSTSGCWTSSFRALSNRHDHASRHLDGSRTAHAGIGTSARARAHRRPGT